MARLYLLMSSATHQSTPSPRKGNRENGFPISIQGTNPLPFIQKVASLRIVISTGVSGYFRAVDAADFDVTRF